MEKQISHPVLGTLRGEKSEWRVPREIAFACTGYSTRNISLSVADGLSEPTAEQLAALVRLIETPPSFRNTIAEAVFRAYRDEIRPEYFTRLSDTRYDYGVTLESLPEALEAKDIWKFITGLYYVWVHKDATVSVDYSVTFDPAHELHILIDDGQIDCVWME